MDDRINDIVQEVEQQVHSLGLQLKRFNRHEKLSTSLFEKELALAYVKIHNYDSELIPLRKNVSESLALKNEKSSDTSLLEKELEEIKKTYVSQQEELQKNAGNAKKCQEMPRTPRNAKKCQEPRCLPQIGQKQGPAVIPPVGVFN